MGTVVVVGAVNVDLVVRAAALPGPGETVVGPSAERYGGGKGANAAVAAARAGATVHYVGAVGDDDLGRTALDELRAEGVRTGAVTVHPSTTTGTALIVVDDRGENQIAVGAGANGLVGPDDVRAALRDVLPGADCLLVSTEIPADAVAAAVRAGTAAGVRCVLDPAPVLDVVGELLALGPLLTPNAGEAAAVAALVAPGPAAGPGPSGGAAGPDDVARPGDAGEPGGAAGSGDVARPGGGDGSGGAVAGDGPEAHARAVAAVTGAPVVVTLGGDGALVAEPSGDSVTVRRVPARTPPAVVDTTGAGDTFTGVLAARLAAGDDLDAAVRTANVAAALSVAAAGARTGMPAADAITAAAGEDDRR